MANAVAKKKNAELSTDLLGDIMEFAGEGATFDSSEMEIPFIRIAQAMSPQISKSKPEFIKGMGQGDMYNTVTSHFWEGTDGVEIVPCYQTTKYLEFTPRDEGGGFHGEIPADDPRIRTTTRNGSKEILDNGNELVKSDQHFCLVLDDDGGFQKALIDMKSTQLKVSRRWKSQIASQKVKRPDGTSVLPPLFATRWKIGTVEQSNAQGTWYNYTVSPVGLVESRDMLLDAKAFRDSIQAGEVKAAPEGPPASTNDDEDIPF
tara:strand:+ start:1624 stop:2406 length:783 start_codon:yes stop_codon:yes gene_type:complete